MSASLSRAVSRRGTEITVSAPHSAVKACRQRGYLFKLADSAAQNLAAPRRAVTVPTALDADGKPVNRRPPAPQTSVPADKEPAPASDQRSGPAAHNSTFCATDAALGAGSKPEQNGGSVRGSHQRIDTLCDQGHLPIRALASVRG